MVSTRQILGPRLRERDDIGCARVQALDLVDNRHDQPQALFFRQMNGSLEVHPRRAIPYVNLAPVSFDDRSNVLKNAGLNLFEIVSPDMQPIGSVLFVEQEQGTTQNPHPQITKTVELPIELVPAEFSRGQLNVAPIESDCG